MTNTEKRGCATCPSLPNAFNGCCKAASLEQDSTMTNTEKPAPTPTPDTSQACLDIADLDGSGANYMLGYLAGKISYQGQLSAQDWTDALDSARLSMMRHEQAQAEQAARRQATRLDAWAAVRVCPTCSGRGRVDYGPGDPVLCLVCHGTGYAQAADQ